MSGTAQYWLDLFESAINDKALATASPQVLEALSKVPSPELAYVVTDGIHRAEVYGHHGWLSVGPDPREDDPSLYYWDCYSDIVEYACEHVPGMDMEGAWIEDAEGNVVDDYED